MARARWAGSERTSDALSGVPGWLAWSRWSFCGRHQQTRMAVPPRAARRPGAEVLTGAVEGSSRDRSAAATLHPTAVAAHEARGRSGHPRNRRGGHWARERAGAGIGPSERTVAATDCQAVNVEVQALGRTAICTLAASAALPCASFATSDCVADGTVAQRRLQAASRQWAPRRSAAPPNALGPEKTYACKGQNPSRTFTLAIRDKRAARQPLPAKGADRGGRSRWIVMTRLLGWAE